MVGEFFKYHRGDRGSPKLSESIFLSFYIQFFYIFKKNLHLVYMKTEYVLCLSVSIEINAALEISKKDAMFSARN